MTYWNYLDNVKNLINIAGWLLIWDFSAFNLFGQINLLSSILILIGIISELVLIKIWVFSSSMSPDPNGQHNFLIIVQFTKSGYKNSDPDYFFVLSNI